MHHIKPQIIKTNGHNRPGKGFSPDELKGAGLNAGDARRLRIPLDRKRKSCHDENIANIKSHLENAPAKAKPAAARTTKPKK